MKKILDCRMTRAGAYTAPANATEGVTIQEFDHSRSGNHWKVKISFQNETDCVEIRDISNSGKHSCYLIYGDGREELVCKPSDPPCCQ